MSNSIDKLIELFKSQSDWQTPIWVSRGVIEVKTTEEMSVVTDEKAPLAKLEYRDESGNAVFIQKFNLTGLDAHIGKLIKLRDTLADVSSNAPAR